MTTTTRPRTYSSPVVCAMAGITYRQLDLWVRKDWLHPDRHCDEGPPGHTCTSGHPRVWSEPETIKAVCLARMVRAGITPQRAAQFLDDGVLATLVTQPLPEVLG